MQSALPPSRLRRQQRAGFTLIELLTVIGIIAILAAIAVGVANGVQNQQAAATAKAQIEGLRVALEDFRKRYGDYPYVNFGGDPANTAAAQNLYSYLSNEVALDGTSIPTDDQQPFISDENYTIEDDMIVDPWGNPYLYHYKTSADDGSWDYPSYHIFSAGPDGAFSTDDFSPSTGIFSNAPNDYAEANLDNIEPGR